MLAALVLPMLVGGQQSDPLGSLTPTPRLNQVAGEIAAEAVKKFGKDGLKNDQIGITIVEIDRSSKSQSMGHHRGDQAFYPASVVKLFYFAYAHHLLNEKKLTLTPELSRAMDDMIRESSNDATSLVLDTITGTTSGPELSPAALRPWMDKRQAVNRWFNALGYQKVNACQKTWNEGPYGRERQGYGPNFELRNSLTANMTARLMTEIALLKMISPSRSKQMLQALKRSIPAETRDTDYQAAAFTGKALPKGSELYSKAGYTDTVRHDVAYVKLPDGKELTAAIFTKDNSNRTELIPFIASEIIRRYSAE